MVLRDDTAELLDFSWELRFLSRLVRLQARLADRRLAGIYETLRIAIAIQAQIVAQLGKGRISDDGFTRRILRPHAHTHPALHAPQRRQLPPARR